MRRRRPIQPGNEQRYWRRRANRRVRKARRTRSAARLALTVMIHGGVAAALLWSFYLGAQRLLANAEFTFERIEVRGAERASVDGIVESLSPYIGQNLFAIDLAAVERAARRDAWVREATVKRVLPDALRVVVAERRPAAAAAINGLVHVVDPTGHVIGVSGELGSFDLPVLTRLPAKQDPRLAPLLRRGVAVAERLRREVPPFFDRIAELDVTEPGRVSVTTVYSGPRILLDPRRVERNLREYVALRRQIAARAGEIDYVDLRWRDRITVKPTSNHSRKGG